MPTTYKFANFFDTEILASISAGATTLMVTPTAAMLLPTLAVDEHIQLTLWDGVQAPEIVSVTDNPQTGTLTVLRGQEGTTAKAWESGTQIAAALTAAVINAALAAYFDFLVVLDANFLPLTGGELTGPLILPDADPVDNNEAVRKSYVDQVQGDKLPLTGGAMTGDINMQDNHIFGLPEPIADAEPATKGYADALVGEGNTDIMAILTDRSGVLASAGSDVAYTVDPTQDHPANVDGDRIAFRPHVVNGVSATLKVGAAAAAPIRVKSGVAIPDGALLANYPYTFVYSSAQTAWLLDAAVDVMRLTQLLVTGLATFSSTSHLVAPNGTTAQRPGVLAAAQWRYNSTVGRMEYSNGVVWLGHHAVASVVGLVMDVTGNTTATLTADEATLVDSNGNAVKHSAVNVGLDSTTTGAGGVDTGTRAANTQYYLWLVSNGTTIAATIHAANTTPPAIAGYTFTKRVGWLRTDASSNFFRIRQRGNHAQYVVGAAPALNVVIDSGVRGTYDATSPALSARSLAGIIPATAQSVIVSATNVGNAGAVGHVLVAPINGWGGSNTGISGSTTQSWPIYLNGSIAMAASAEFMLDTLNVSWASSHAGGQLACVGWRDNI